MSDMGTQKWIACESFKVRAYTKSPRLIDVKGMDFHHTLYACRRSLYSFVVDTPMVSVSQNRRKRHRELSEPVRVPS